MSKRRKITLYADCPYYQWEKYAKIVCKEDDTDSLPHINLIFATIEERDAYEAHYCKGAWKTCPLAKAINEKFGYEA